MNNQENMKESVKVTLIGAVINVALALIKIIIGYLTRVNSLFADGIHSLSDLISDGVILIFIKASYQPATRSRPYGNRKLESFVSLIVSGVLLAVVVGLVFNSVKGGETGTIKSIPAIVVILISIAAKEMVFRYTKRIGIKIKSPALMANAWHHRSDSLSSAMILFCLVMGIFFGNPHVWDLLGVGVVAVMIIRAVWEISRGSIKELLDHAPSKDVLNTIERVIEKDKRVSLIYDVKIRTIGGLLYVGFSIEVKDDLTVKEANEIRKDLKGNIHHVVSDVCSIVIQIFPRGDLASRVLSEGWDHIKKEELT